MKTHRWTLTLLLVAGAWRASGQTAVDLSRQGKVGTGTVLPAHCTVGQIFFKTDAPAGTNLFACSTPNSWASVGLPVLAGDASGTQQSVTVQAIQGHGLSAAAPADQNVLRWNVATGLWEPSVVPATGPAAPPAACVAGSFYLQSDPANNIQQLYVCSNTNSWAMASARSGPAVNRPLNCVAGQTWLSTDTGALTYCSTTGSPGTWSTALAGPQGPSGPQGPTGVAGTIGPTGANGNTILSGSGAPSAGLGVNGDFYLSTAANCLYGPKASGAWPGSCASLVGPQGPQGLGGSPPTWSAVAFSSTPTFALSAPVQGFQMTLTGNVTSSAFSGTLQSGQLIVFKICQNPAGGHTFAPPASVVGFGSFDTTGSVCNTQAFQYDGTNLAAITPMRSDNPLPRVSAVNGLYSLPPSPTVLIGTTDSRLSDARTPTAHAAAHAAAGQDPLTLDAAQVAGAEVTSNKSASPLLGLSDTLYPTQHAVKTYVDSNTISPVSPAITGTAAMQQVSSTVANPTTGNDPNDRRAWDLYVTTDSSASNPNYSNQEAFRLGFVANHGDNSYGGGTNAKTTFLPFVQSFIATAAGQRIAQGLTMSAYGMGDSALHSESINYANGPVAGDEADGGFNVVSYSQQQANLAKATIISIPPQTTCNTTTRQAITASKDPQTVAVAGTANCHPGDWVVLGEAPNNGYPNIGLTQITAVSAGVSISGIFRNNQPNGAAVTPALVLNLDSTYQMGQQRVLVNTGSAATYSAGIISSISGGGFTGSGVSWTPDMVGGSQSAPYANIGVISLDSDTYTGSPFNYADSQGPLRSWYEITSVPGPTSIGIHSFSVAGDAGYRGKGAPSTYIIRPGARILKINGNQVILETTTTAWTVGDTVECAISPYPDVTGFQYHMNAWTPGGSYRGFMNVRNTGARTFGTGFEVNGADMQTGSNADQYGFGTAFSSVGKTSGATFVLGGSGSGQALYIPTTGSTDTGRIYWRQSTGLEFTLGRDETKGPAGMLEIGQGGGGTNYMDFYPAGGGHTWTWPAQSGTVALTSDNQPPIIATRAIPAAVNDEIDIGSFDLSASNVPYAGVFNVSVTTFYRTKSFTVTVSPGTAMYGAWAVIPANSDTGNLYNGDSGGFDYALDAMENGATVHMRLRRTSSTGSSAGAAVTSTVQIMQTGTSVPAAYTASTSVSSVSAPVSYPVSYGVWGGPFIIGKAPTIAATIDPSSLTASRSFTLPNMGGTVGLVLTGTTGSIGGGALAAGACAAGTANVAGATTGMAVVVSPSGGIDPTNNNVLGATWEGFVSSPNTVTVKVCAPVAGTPAAAAYNVRVIQ